MDRTAAREGEAYFHDLRHSEGAIDMAEPIRWDLSQLVKDTDADSIISELDRLVADAVKFRNKYQGNITGLTRASELP